MAIFFFQNKKSIMPFHYTNILPFCVKAIVLNQNFCHKGKENPNGLKVLCLSERERIHVRSSLFYSKHRKPQRVWLTWNSVFSVSTHCISMASYACSTALNRHDVALKVNNKIKKNVCNCSVKHCCTKLYHVETFGVNLKLFYQI